MKKYDTLKKNNELRTVFNKGKWLRDKNIVLYFLPNKFHFNRLGVAVSKKQGNSVVRNRVKRVLRESFRLQEDNIKKGYDIVFLWKGSEPKKITLKEVYVSMEKLFKKVLY